MRFTNLVIALGFSSSACVFPGADEDSPSNVGAVVPATGSPADVVPPPATGGAAGVTDPGPMNPDLAPIPGTGGTTAPPEPAVGPCEYASTMIVDVQGVAQLKQALAVAAPGTMIRMAGGNYKGDFVASKSGTAGQPIILCSEANATISADEAKEDSFNLLGDHWVLSGFTVSGGLRGVVLDGANFNRLVGLSVHGSGQEAIHLRSHSSDNVVEACKIWNTGLSTPDYGEGIYVGSAKSNWKQYTGSASTPDRSDRNQILDNEIGPNVTAEHIDIKEGTQGGLVQGNLFDGKGISGKNYADSWVDVKGNDYVVADNVGVDSPLDGFQTHVVESSWGHNITFLRNVAKVNGPGYGISVSSDSNNVVVGCGNSEEGAAKGLSNRTCALVQ